MFATWLLRLGGKQENLISLKALWSSVTKVNSEPLRCTTRTALRRTQPVLRVCRTREHTHFASSLTEHNLRNCAAYVVSLFNAYYHCLLPSLDTKSALPSPLIASMMLCGPVKRTSQHRAAPPPRLISFDRVSNDNVFQWTEEVKRSRRVFYCNG